MTTVNAVYRGGVLCPAEPLPLAEGAEVRVTVEPAVASPFDRAAWENRIRSAKTIQEWMDAANALPPTGDGHDLIAALNENRKMTGEQPISSRDESEQAR
jgi:predicted DNA-binding antitoxin AbrB/MazE fold protein